MCVCVGVGQNLNMSTEVLAAYQVKNVAHNGGGRKEERKENGERDQKLRRGKCCQEHTCVALPLEKALVAVAAVIVVCPFGFCFVGLLGFCLALHCRSKSKTTVWVWGAVAGRRGEAR